MVNTDLSNTFILTSEFSEIMSLNLNLSGSQMLYVDFNNADLTNANFNNSNLEMVNFSNSNLRNASFFNSIVDANSGLKEVNFSGSNLSGADLRGAFVDVDGFMQANFTNSIYSESTIFPSSIDPVAEGMIFVSEVPLPAGIYLFLSGLVGLGLMRGRNA